jgi:alpha-L-fucosidase
MKINRSVISLIIITSSLLSGGLKAQPLHDHDHTYYPVKDALVKQKLEDWQDLKFGLMMTWGPYSQWGIVESWSLSPEDYGWSQRKKGNKPKSYFEYKKEYEDLQKTFNPIDFAPERWAKAAKYAGIRYVMPMSKHHDGFCMFDTKTTDYKITDKKTPFHTAPKADIVKEIVKSFSSEGFRIGMYFSKPDWHSRDYWSDYFPPLDRNVNYDPDSYPEKWEKFVQFTHEQIMELMTNYGDIDILWLDGGWVAKQNPQEMEDFYRNSLKNIPSGFLKNKIVNQDIRMDEIAAKARKLQPGLIVVDRAVPGVNENYLTPENRIPEKMIPFPWESCITATNSWSYTPNDTYKSSKQIIHILVDIVSKGGNLLLNIAPGPNGDWDSTAYQRLQEIGDWMHLNSEAIYDTRAIAPYRSGKVCYTQNKKTKAVYSIYLPDKDETTLPSKVRLHSIHPKKGSIINLLGYGKVKWEKVDGDVIITVPGKAIVNPPCKEAWTFKMVVE